MARPKKEGLDYFSVDVVFDEKIDAIESLHKNDGLVWVLRFWQKAYRTMTGTVDFRGLFAELFANKCRITIEEHEKILNTAVSIDFCHEIEPGIYTSNGIQKRISGVSKERKEAIERQNKVKERKVKERKVKERKVKESKVKESKVKESPGYSANNSQTLSNKVEQFTLDVNSFLEYSDPMRSDFIKYWTEPNRSKTKLRHEIEKTWDTKKRLARWCINDKKFSSSSTTGVKNEFERNAADKYTDM